MPEYIEREALMRRIKEIHCAECDSYHGVRCRACWVDDTLDYIDSEPAADVAPVRPELRKAVKLLHDEYANAKRLSFVRNPLAYALYQVWKAADGGARMDLSEGGTHDA